MEEINAYRQENFDIQNRYEGEELFDKQDELQNKYERLLDDPKASSFLHAEAGFCRMIQEINEYIMEGLKFE